MVIITKKRIFRSKTHLFLLPLVNDEYLPKIFTSHHDKDYIASTFFIKTEEYLSNRRLKKNHQQIQAAGSICNLLD